MYYTTDVMSLFEIEVIVMAIGALYIAYKFEYLLTRFVTFLCMKRSIKAASTAMGTIAGSSIALICEATVLEDVSDPSAWVAFVLYSVCIIWGCYKAYLKTIEKHNKKLNAELSQFDLNWLNEIK